MALANRMADQRQHQTLTRQTPRRSHQSNSSVERYHQALQAQVRALRSAWQARSGLELRTEDRAVTWLVRHAAWLIQRYQPHTRGPTSYDLIRGTPYQGRIVEFGEIVLVLEPGEKLTGGVSRMAKFSNRWAQRV